MHYLNRWWYTPHMGGWELVALAVTGSVTLAGGMLALIALGRALAMRAARDAQPEEPRFAQRLLELEQLVNELPITWERIRDEMEEIGVTVERKRRQIAARESRAKHQEQPVDDGLTERERAIARFKQRGMAS